MNGPDPDPNDPTPGMQIWGWMSPPELRWLSARAASMQSVVEVGSLHGRSAYALGAACPGWVIAIDLWDDPGGHCLPSFLRNTEKLHNVHAVQGRSPGVATSVETEFGQPEMVFLDGEHDYASVTADLEAWWPLAGRLLCGHDYSHPSWDVAQAVDDFFAALDLSGRVQVAPDTSIWYVERA